MRVPVPVPALGLLLTVEGWPAIQVASEARSISCTTLLAARACAGREQQLVVTCRA
ncbi:hypothetical protein GCM10027586_19250 [Kineococcus gypseus]